LYTPLIADAEATFDYAEENWSSRDLRTVLSVLINKIMPDDKGWDIVTCIHEAVPIVFRRLYMYDNTFPRYLKPMARNYPLVR
jgi:hypothetical protein